ncbi:MAG: single-stranded DNA-binding protein [Cyanobacteria bacterium J06607_6]
MNNCILMAEIVQAPQLRYTADNQTPIAEFVVKFPGLREGDAAGQLKVVGWGNLAQEIQERYRMGDRVLLEGRLSMNTLERPEGFKEKRAEMTVQRVSPLNDLQSLPIAEATPVAEGRFAGGTGGGAVPPSAPAVASSSAPAAAPAASTPAPEYDDIPF